METQYYISGLDVFMAGWKRYAESNAILSTHNFGYHNGNDLNENHPVYKTYGELYKSFVISNNFLKLLRTKSSSKMYTLTTKQIADLNIINFTFKELKIEAGIFD